MRAEIVSFGAGGALILGLYGVLVACGVTPAGAQPPAPPPPPGPPPGVLVTSYCDEHQNRIYIATQPRAPYSASIAVAPNDPSCTGGAR